MKYLPPALRSRRRGIPLPRQAQPDSVRLTYLAALRRMLALARHLVMREVNPILPRVADAHDAKVRTDADPISSINRAVDRASKEFYKQFTGAKIADLARQAATATSAFQREQLWKQIRSETSVDPVLGEPWLKARIAAFTAENVALIKTVPDTYFSQVEQQVIGGVRAGTMPRDIAANLTERFGVAEDRAKLIARDQVGKFYSELQKTRQASLGISQYVWRTSNDGRVREAHAERDGLLCDWDEGPGDASDPGDGEHPGDGINCRCYAEPVLEDVTDSNDAAPTDPGTEG